MTFCATVVLSKMADDRYMALLTLCISSLFAGVLSSVQQNYRGYVGGDVGSPTQGSPWPMPQSMTTTRTQLDIDPDLFLFVVSSPKTYCADIEDAFNRYKVLTFGREATALKFAPRQQIKERGRSNGVVMGLQVNVQAGCVAGAFPTLESDESYKLVVDSSGSATLHAAEVWGALRGLETFSQLVYRKNDGGFSINQTSISDFPRFKHRGLLLDTSRHFLSMKVLKDNLDVMSQNKFNVFHWHIVDDPSFPYQSSTFPDMSVKGAFTPYRHVYTQGEINELIEYARKRGIRVIPEFDTPGHTKSWGKAIADLLTKCYSEGKPNGEFGPINPVDNSTFPFLSQFFAEVAGVFPDSYVHLGGDEVSFNCWESNPDITAFMKKMGYGTDYAKLEQYYMQKLLDIVNGLKKSYIIWQEVIDNGVTVAENTVVDVWKAGYQKELSRVTQLGYKTLLSACWYLDYIAIGPQWKSYYMCDPHQFNGTDAQKKLVMGGEACLWGEYVDNTNMMSRLWPRASAVAERLWSDKTVSDVQAATPRIEEMRCRLVRRGYPAEPIDGPGFCLDEY